jgi:hypothetical protein
MPYLLFVCLLFFCGNRIKAQTYQLGQTYYDANQYIEYQPGNIPLIIIVPHGGYLEPASIPDRNCTGCSTTSAAYTQELARILSQEVTNNTTPGTCRPHLIINHLHRKKLDANEDITIAANGNPQAEAAWYAFHNFIADARDTALQYYSRALLVDLQGHTHSIQRLELGYLLSGAELRQADNIVDTIQTSSINGLVQQHPTPCLSQYIRGYVSLAAAIEHSNSFTAVPSLTTPAPLVGEPYFSGGYNTQRYGSNNGGALDAIQLKCPESMRLDSTTRTFEGQELGQAIFNYVANNYSVHRLGNVPSQIASCFIIIGTSKIKQQASPLLYPNPTQNYVQIAFDEYPLKATLYNHAGQLLHQQEIENQQALLSLETVPLGTYYLKLETPTGQYVQLIVKTGL